MIQLQIDCEPEPWVAATKGKNGFYDKKSKHKEFVRWQLKGQYRDEPIQGHVSVEFFFFIPIPKAHPKQSDAKCSNAAFSLPLQMQLTCKSFMRIASKALL